MDNWVGRRARRERNLREKAPEVWSLVRKALQDVCDSYNEHYAHTGRAADWRPENGKRVTIARQWHHASSGHSYL